MTGSNVVAFPSAKPPFLEVCPEEVDGYKFVIRYRDERYRPMVFRRCMSRREALQHARNYGGIPILGEVRR
ncbi:hypothetical protein TM233_58940 [Bradyrhizobium sp. TM233]|nr:hypothetical protein TM233_58940 [Bradyrhizobium sp. TM233]